MKIVSYSRKRIFVENEKAGELILFNYFSHELRRQNTSQRKGSCILRKVKPPIFVDSLYDTKSKFCVRKQGIIRLQEKKSDAIGTL